MSLSPLTFLHLGVESEHRGGVRGPVVQLVLAHFLRIIFLENKRIAQLRLTTTIPSSSQSEITVRHRSEPAHGPPGPGGALCSRAGCRPPA